MTVLNSEEIVQEGGETVAGNQFIGSLVIVGMQKYKYNMVCREMRDWLAAGLHEAVNLQMMQYSVNAVRGVCCIWYRLCVVLTLNNEMEIQRGMTEHNIVR